MLKASLLAYSIKWLLSDCLVQLGSSQGVMAEGNQQVQALLTAATAAFAAMQEILPEVLYPDWESTRSSLFQVLEGERRPGGAWATS